MKRVAITGISGYLGTQLLRRLKSDEGVELIVGIDLREPSLNPAKLKFYNRDVRKPFADILTENQIDTAIHLAFVVAPIHDETRSHSINIEGSKSFLESCRQSPVKQLLYLSSYSAYGAHPDNPEQITEDTPLRPNKAFPYPSDKAEVDILFQEFMAATPDRCVTIIRSVAVVGPASDICGLKVLFTPVMFRPSGYDPLWQFVHEDDLMDVILTLLKGAHKGVFNVAAEGGLHYSAMIKAAGKPSVSLPASLLSWLISLSWRLRLQARAQGGGLELIKHPTVLSTKKLRQITDYKFRYSGAEAFQSFLKAIQANR